MYKPIDSIDLLFFSKGRFFSPRCSRFFYVLYIHLPRTVLLYTKKLYVLLYAKKKKFGTNFGTGRSLKLFAPSASWAPSSFFFFFSKRVLAIFIYLRTKKKRLLPPRMRKIFCFKFRHFFLGGL